MAPMDDRYAQQIAQQLQAIATQLHQINGQIAALTSAVQSKR
jgi:prefoldin subunit 5